MKAEPRRLIKRRSPRVVLIGKNPVFPLLVGLINSSTVNKVRVIAIATKKMAVGKVHAIQLTRLALT